ncbi:MAG: NACHT domain-containing protein [Deltaproteobacteria bacterium]|nr:NACHT domain-containing protein [Deltaproteobacteria bacterium]
MPWPPWPKADEKGLARYVNPRAAQSASQIAAPNRLDLGGLPEGRRRLVEFLYDSLAEGEAPIQYAREKFHFHDQEQLLRPPGEILGPPGEGTCLDLAALFCGLCLAHDLLPLLIVIEGHALVAVSLSHERKTDGADRWDAFDRRELEDFSGGLCDEAAVLRALVESGTYVALETTGFARSRSLDPQSPEGSGRDGRGLLSFDRAVAAGQEQLHLPGRPLRFALDVHLLQAKGFSSHDPGEKRRQKRLEMAAREDLRGLAGAGLARPDYRSGVSGLLDYYVGRFVGRQAEWNAVVDFVAQGEKPYLLVEASGGFGKSTFMAHLVHRSETGTWPQPAPLVVFFFVRSEGGRNTPTAFLRAVNSQLLGILGAPGGTPTDLEELRVQWEQLWQLAHQAATETSPLLLLVDGLDEMAPASTRGDLCIADLLPSVLGEFTRVIVSSRPNPPAQEQVVREHPLRRSAELSLGGFDISSVQALLRHVSGKTELDRFAERVRRLTGGEPLFVRFVGETLASQGEEALFRLEQDPPEDVGGFFRDQLRALEKTAEGELSWDLLGLLVAAVRGLTASEMAAALETPGRLVRKALAPLERFLLGSDRLELMHANLRGALEDDLGEGEVNRYRDRILAWCRGFEEQGWPESTPDYALAAYARHLFELDRQKELSALVSSSWLECHRRRFHRLDGFVRDAELALEAAREAEPQDLLSAIQICQVLATAGSFATWTPVGAIAVLARTGRLGEAEGYAALVQDPQRRCKAFLELAAAHLAEGRGENARGALDHCLDAAAAITFSSWMVDCLVELAGALGQARHGAGLESALELAGSLSKEDPGEAFTAAAALVPGFVAAGLGDRARDVAAELLGQATGGFGFEILPAAAALAAQMDPEVLKALTSQAIQWTTPRPDAPAPDPIPQDSSDDDEESAVSLAVASQGLASLAQAWERAGEPDRALELAQGALDLLTKDRDARQRVRGYLGCVEYLRSPLLLPVGARAAQGARESVTRMQGPWVSYALCEAISVQAVMGDREGLFTLKSWIEDSSLDQDDLDGPLEGLAGAFAHLGEAVAAREAAEGILCEDDSYQAEAWLKVATGLAHCQLFPEAIAAAGENPEAEKRAAGLGAVAIEYLRAGGRQEAVDLAEKAIREAQCLDGESGKAAAMAEVSLAFSDRASSDRALNERAFEAPQEKAREALERSLKELAAIPPGTRTGALVQPICLALVAAERFDEAEDLVLQLRMEPMVSEVLGAVVEGLVTVGRGEEGKHRAAKLKKRVNALSGRPFERVRMQLALASAMESVGEPVAASEARSKARKAALARSYGDSPSSDLLALVARSEAAAGQAQEALDLLRKAEFIGPQARPPLSGSGPAAAALEILGRREEAHSLGRQAVRGWLEDDEDTVLRPDRFVELAEVLGDREEDAWLEELLQISNRSVLGPDRGEALAALAAGFHRAGRHDLACRLVLEAFSAARLQGRYKFFRVLGLAAPLLAALDQGESLWWIFRAIYQADSWWQPNE